MPQKSPKFYLFAVILMISSMGIMGAAYQSDTFFLIKKNFALFSEVVQEVNSRYVDETDPEKLIRHGITSMLELLDPYTVLIDEADNQTMEILTTGRYAGVGIEVGSRGGRLVIIAPIEGYSAYQKGVRAGDTILSVDGISVVGMTMEDLDSLIRGEPGTLLILMVERAGFDQPIEFELIRENVEVKNIAYSGYVDADSTIGIVTLSRFGQGAASEVREALVNLQKNRPLEGFILDLRNNPGGLMDEAVDIVDKFVGPGIQVVKTQGRSFDASFTSSTDEPVIFDGPVAILQNNGSASASEIVAGALQDLDRAVIVGTRSFGKGLVQIVRPLSYNNSLKITVSRYYIPSGRSIQSAIYSHLEAGHTLQVPDSLRKEFKTVNGRSVYDGIGIDPDVIVEESSQKLAEIALLQNSAYFFYANEYQSKNHTFDSDSIDQTVLDDFYAYLERTGFDFTTRSERYLASLETQLVEDGLPNAVSNLNELKVVVREQKIRELKSIESIIKSELFQELMSRYKGESGRFEASMRYDPVVNKAVELLRNEPTLNQILGE
jgi:carboxyl-terminal processing protease